MHYITIEVANELKIQDRHEKKIPHPNLTAALLSHRTVPFFKAQLPTERTSRLLPSRRPPNFLFRRFHAGMKSRFILITRWNFKFYGVFEPGDDARQ